MSQAENVEKIGDFETVSRTIWFPQMTREESNVVFTAIFDFQDGGPESVIWRKYCRDEIDVHSKAREQEAKKQVKKPNVKYLGFGNALVETVRKIKSVNPNGYGFEIVHEPSEGVFHAHIFYDLPVGTRYSALTKPQKMDLRFNLGKLFQPLIPQSK